MFSILHKKLPQVSCYSKYLFMAISLVFRLSNGVGNFFIQVQGNLGKVISLCCNTYWSN